MNYKQIYNQLIEKRRSNPITKKDCYVEKHHIVPKSEGGTDDKSNIVNLTAREHYIAHLLLAKIYNDYKMWCAIQHLCYGSRFHKRRYVVSSRTYEMVKRYLSLTMSERMKGRKQSLEHRRKISEALKGRPSNMKGKCLSEEARKKISLRMKGKPSNTKGKHLSEDTRRRMSDSRKGNPKLSARKGIPIPTETRKKISLALKGRPTWAKGKHLSEETRRKMSETHRRIGTKPPSPVGKRWFNNGKVNVLCLECPKGFVKGRLKKCRTT